MGQKYSGSRVVRYMYLHSQRAYAYAKSAKQIFNWISHPYIREDLEISEHLQLVLNNNGNKTEVSLKETKARIDTNLAKRENFYGVVICCSSLARPHSTKKHRHH